MKVTHFPSQSARPRPKQGLCITYRSNVAYFPIVACLVLCGCSAGDAPDAMTAETIHERVSELEQNVSQLSGRAADGALHALSSADPEMRAQAALAFAKTGRSTAAVFARLEELALHDEDPVVRAAGLTAICRIDGRSERVRAIVQQLASDPQVGLVARSLDATASSR